MQPEESIVVVQKRFTHIVNHLTELGKEFDREELNIKVLKCLDRSWQPKVTTISESRDLLKLSTAALFGKLMEHELELKRLKEQETVERKPKGLALKASEQNEINEEKKDVEHDETINLLTKRFSRFLKKKSRDRNQQKRRYPKPNESNSSNYTCFGCGKTGHIKMDCSNNQSKDKSASKKVERSKGRRAYILWEENEVSSTSSSSTESEENNLCFMVKDEGSISNSVSEFSMESDNYDQLIVAFKETHDEANRLVVICSKLQKGRENLESLLGSQNVVFNKNGIGYNPGNVTNVKKLQVFLFQQNQKGSKRNQWYLDSGCSKHMTGDLTKFTSLKLKAEGHVTYGDNNRGRILGRGTVGTGNSTTIENVFYVEELKHSLLSISQLYDKGYKVNFKSNGCTISSDSSSKVLFTGKRVNNIYLLDIMETNSSNECLLSRSDESWLWHRRLAQIHINHLNKLKSKDLVSGLPNIKFKDNRLCDACVKDAVYTAAYVLNKTIIRPILKKTPYELYKGRKLDGGGPSTLKEGHPQRPLGPTTKAMTKRLDEDWNKATDGGKPIYTYSKKAHQA
ncbi:uncharacterized protein [Phaseolus vulgaris]|uniref:uncharacterized protein n=1 Tax=Phaseolus vulgaris TaxID=3885 RepID=UPI0035C974E6